jgi:hypothetical protein
LSKKRLVVAVDSTGVKVFNRGDWRSFQKDRDGHRWIKLHVVVDKTSKQVLSFRVTDQHTHDSELFIPLLKQVDRLIGPGHIKKVLGDRGYDSKPNFNYVEKRGAIPTIRPRKSANPMKEQPLTRKRLVKSILRHGYKKWAKKAGYGLRWAAEGFFSAYKRLYGEFLRATSLKGMLNEIKMRLHFHNKLITYKPPTTNP